MNNINICGRLTAEPEMRTTPGGISVCVYDLAVKRPKVKDTTDFLTCVSWRQGAEYISKYGHKGDMVAVSGVLTVRSWDDKDGNKRKSYEIVADTVEIVGGKKTETQPSVVTLPVVKEGFSQNEQVFETVLFGDEDIPF